MDLKKFKSANWRIVIPDLKQYQNASPAQLMELKQLILDRLKKRPQDPRSHMQSEFDRGLRYYHIAVQTHATGVPHLDILLVYDKSILRRPTDFDYLLKHGNINTYRTLNNAVLNYGKKQDNTALSNLPESNNEVLELQEFKRDPYRYLELQMRKDPLHFNLEQYVEVHDLAQYMSGWSGIKIKLKDMQRAAANLKLKDKPGFKYIDRKLIQARLKPQELTIFDSWDGYQTIVDHLNQMIRQKGYRQMKTSNLLITGAPNVGKTSLFSNPNHKLDKACVEDFCAIYPMGMTHWFPKYQSHVYHMILWNEAKLTSYSYDLILKFLEGSYMDLPNKGGSSRKVDNPLVVMTSNLTLEQMILQKFPSNESYQEMARKNLAVRVKNVIVPDGYNLFLLQRLLVTG